MFALLLPLLQPLMSKVLDLIPDPAAKLKMQQDMTLAIMDASQKLDAAQSDVNKTEAANSSIFVAGWRPFIGWVCGMALLYQYIVRPLVTWGSTVAGYHVPDMPGLDDSLWQLMFGMLGLGGLRSYEKVQGVATAAIAPLGRSK